MKDKNFPKFEHLHVLDKEEALRRIDAICKYKNYGNYILLGTFLEKKISELVTIGGG